jgi:hypothetical protein
VDVESLQRRERSIQWKEGCGTLALAGLEYGGRAKLDAEWWLKRLDA